MNPYGQMIGTAHSYGYGVKDVWAAIFIWNEKHFQSKPERVISDEQGVDMLKDAFPDRKCKSILNGTQYRVNFNLGKLSGGRVPKPLAQRYQWRNKTLVKMIPLKPVCEWPKKTVTALNPPTLAELLQVAM